MSDLTTNLNSLLSLAGEGLPGFELEENPTDNAAYELMQQSTRRSSPEASFRSVKASAERNLTWYVPGTDLKEIAGDVLAVRGYIIKANHGFMLYNAREKVMACRTIAIEPARGGRIDGDGPLPTPMYAPEKYNEKGVPDDSLYNLNPIGMQGPCIECVKAGRNRIVTTDEQGKTTVDECGGTVSVVMVVTHIGYAKANVAKRTQEVVWQSVLDVRSPEGEQMYQAPFVLNVNISRMTALRGIGAKLQVKSQPNTPVPADVQTWRVFYSELMQNNHIQPAKGRRLIILPQVELWAAQPTEAFASGIPDVIKAIPVLRICDELDAQENVKLCSIAHQIYQAEYVAAGGKLDQYGAPVTQRRFSAGSSSSETAPAIAPAAAPVPTVAPATPAPASVPVQAAQQVQTVETTTVPVGPSGMPSVFSRNPFGPQE